MQELSEHGERRLTKYGFSVLTFWTYLLRNRSSRSIQTLGAKMEEELLLLRISAVGAKKYVKNCRKVSIAFTEPFLSFPWWCMRVLETKFEERLFL